MTGPKLKDLVTMLDFFDPDLPIYVVTDVGESLCRVTKVKKTEDEKQLLLFIEAVPGGLYLSQIGGEHEDS